MRVLLVACLALLLVVAAGLVFSLVSTQTQMDTLSAQVTDLESKAAVAAAAPAASAAATADPETAPVAQLPASADVEGVSALPAGVDSTGAVLIGNPDASNVVEVYVDYQCPYCQRWEQTVGAPLFDRALSPDGDLLIKQYNLAFLGEQNATLTPAGASARAASAAACIVNADGPEAFVAFSSAVFAAADPSEPPGQFPADQLATLAKDSGASAAALDCIASEEHVPFVAATTQTGFARGVGGTPTVIVNGTTLGNPFTDPALTALTTS